MTKPNYLPVLIAFSAFLLGVLPASAQSKDWALKSEKEGVKVYYRQTSDVHEVKLTTSLKTSLSGILHLFAEVEQYPDWGYKVVESRLIQKKSDTDLIYYTRFDFPWPLSDRDIVMHSTLIQDPVTKKVVSKSVAEPWHIAEVADVVRIKEARTQWSLYPNETGWLYLEYYIYSNPGGMLPSWLVNMAIDVGPLETIKAIRGKLADPTYQAVKLAHILE